MDVLCEYKLQNRVGCPNATYGCYITFATITEIGYRTIQSFTGMHLRGKTDKDVLEVWFDGTVVEFFPLGLHRIFPSLTLVSLNKCGLKEITRNDLHGLENLEELLLNYNDLTTLPNNLLSVMFKLRRIEFYENKLKFVSSKLLEPVMGRGPKIDFRRNEKIDSFYWPGQAGSVRTIKELMNIIDTNCDKPNMIDLEDLFGSAPVKPRKTKTSNWQPIRHAHQAANNWQPIRPPYPLIDLQPFFQKPEEPKQVCSQEENKQAHNAKLLKGFKNLWLNGNFSDFTVIVGPKKFPVHKWVLCINSPVYAEMFEGQAQAVNEMKIQDLPADAVHDFLRYLYTGEYPENVNIMDAFALAAKLKVTELREICEKMICENVLSNLNAYNVFMLGHVYDSNKLKVAAFNKIKSMFPDANLSDDLMKEPENLKKLIEYKSGFEDLMHRFNKRM